MQSSAPATPESEAKKSVTFEVAESVVHWLALDTANKWIRFIYSKRKIGPDGTLQTETDKIPRQ